jgi:hypothetical protein
MSSKADLHWIMASLAQSVDEARNAVEAEGSPFWSGEDGIDREKALSIIRDAINDNPMLLPAGTSFEEADPGATVDDGAVERGAGRGESDAAEWYDYGLTGKDGSMVAPVKIVFDDGTPYSVSSPCEIWQALTGRRPPESLASCGWREALELIAHELASVTSVSTESDMYYMVCRRGSGVPGAQSISMREIPPIALSGNPMRPAFQVDWDRALAQEREKHVTGMPALSTYREGALRITRAMEETQEKSARLHSAASLLARISRSSGLVLKGKYPIGNAEAMSLLATALPDAVKAMAAESDGRPIDIALAVRKAIDSDPVLSGLALAVERPDGVRLMPDGTETAPTRNWRFSWFDFAVCDSRHDSASSDESVKSGKLPRRFIPARLVVANGDAMGVMMGHKASIFYSVTGLAPDAAGVSDATSWATLAELLARCRHVSCRDIDMFAMVMRTDESAAAFPASLSRVIEDAFHSPSGLPFIGDLSASKEAFDGTASMPAPHHRSKARMLSMLADVLEERAGSFSGAELLAEPHGRSPRTMRVPCGDYDTLAERSSNYSRHSTATAIPSAAFVNTPRYRGLGDRIAMDGYSLSVESASIFPELAPSRGASAVRKDEAYKEIDKIIDEQLADASVRTEQDGNGMTYRVHYESEDMGAGMLEWVNGYTRNGYEVSGYWRQKKK